MANYKEMAVPPNQEEIKVKHPITSNTLSAFLFQQTGKDSFQNPDGLSIYYPDIFTSLRKMTLPQQERLLVSFFTERLEGFPNGEELGKELARINNIHWFRPNQEPEQGVLEQLTRTCLERLKYPSRPSTPLKIIRENWGEARREAWSDPWNLYRGPARQAAQKATRQAAYDVAYYMARGAAQDSDCEAAWEATRTPARDAAWGTTGTRRWVSGPGGFEDITWQAQWEAIFEEVNGATGRQEALSIAEKAFRGTTWYAAWEAAIVATRDVARDVAHDAEWIVVKDLMPARGCSKDNPFEPLMEIYELGYWPIGPVINKNRETEFVVFVPPVVSPTGNQ